MSDKAMSAKEQIIQELDRLTEAELRELLDFLAFLKFRGRLKASAAQNEAQAAINSESAEKRREMPAADRSGYANLQAGYEAMAADTARAQAALDWIEIAADGG